ncbi:hypothetical protein [Povalibacter sp.]|uniref:hypothetical protein n=1 Tax=Povalibacter sp. TaxID=1962978 RepID=UPI002F3EAACF
MHIRHITLRIIGITLMLVLGACGSTPSQPQESNRSKSSASPDALVADAMQRAGQHLDLPSALPLIQMAFDKAPDRPDIAWLYAQVCTGVPGCQPESADARLRRLDPNNAAVWLGALGRARNSGDTAAENEILDRMSRAERFDIYWNSLVSKAAIVMSANTAAHMGPTTPDLIATSLNYAIGWLSTVALPAFKPLSDACLTGANSNPATAQRCRTIATVLTRGDSLIAEGLGLSMQQKLATPGSAEAEQIDTQIRRSRYQRETAGQIIATQADQEKFSRELIKLMTTLRREQDVFLTVVRWGQQPVEPPPGWIDPSVG